MKKTSTVYDGESPRNRAGTPTWPGQASRKASRGPSLPGYSPKACSPGGTSGPFLRCPYCHHQVVLRRWLLLRSAMFYAALQRVVFGCVQSVRKSDLRAPKLILIPGGWPGRKSSILGVQTASSYRKTHWTMGFAVGGGRLDPQNRRFPAGPAPGDKDKFWSSHDLCQLVARIFCTIRTCDRRKLPAGLPVRGKRNAGHQNGLHGPWAQ
jgi:hypothetical protein